MALDKDSVKLGISILKKINKGANVVKYENYDRKTSYIDTDKIFCIDEEMKFKVGDIVPYRNTRGNIKKAEIISFETVGKGKVWFHGIDTDTKAKVWYSLHISEKLIQ